MNKFIINEEEKRRILMMHQSATKRQYLNESTDGTKVKLFSDSSRTEIKETATISLISQKYVDMVMAVELTSKPGNKLTGVFTTDDVLTIKDYDKVVDTVYLSSEITEKLNILRYEENLSEDPMKINTYINNSYDGCYSITDLRVVGSYVRFNWSTYYSEDQNNLDEKQKMSPPSVFNNEFDFSCNTKLIRYGKDELNLTPDVTKIMMSMCDEYAMNNKDKESDMA